MVSVPATSTIRDTVERTLPPVVVIIVGMGMMQPELGEVLAGDPIAPRAPEITFGILLWAGYLGPALAVHIESDRTNENGFDLSYWVLLLVVGIWVVAGIAFLIAGQRSPLVAGWIVLSVAAVVVCVRQKHTLKWVIDGPDHQGNSHPVTPDAVR